MTLEITLLGRPQIMLNGQPPANINANKALALFYYLAATGQVHSRQALAGLLWTDLPEDAARRNLRVELNRLRRELGDYLLATRETLAFNADPPFHLDLALFEACAKQPAPTVEELRTAVDLYQDEFLADFHVRDAALFEEWQASERERLAQTVQRLTLRLLKMLIAAKAYDEAIRYVQALLTREPWLEEGHQQLMLLYARTGQRGAVLTQYELCAQTLEDEYGVPLSAATNDLYDRILAGEIGPDTDAIGTETFALTPPKLSAPPFQAPAPLLHFVGRETELAALHATLTQPDTTAIIALVGMGGVGKSALAIHLAHLLRTEYPDGVVWANVATSDPLDILSSWARAFGYDFGGLSDVEVRASALRGVLADKRALFVLDDVRSVARTRPLLVGGAACTHLLTTRDLDVATALNAQPHRLGELTPQASISLLVRILGEDRVAAETEAATAICEHLQFLPLAVEITAQRLVSRPRRRLADMAERLRNVEARLDLSISDRAVRTSFEVSWESLDTNLRRIFALLGVFEGRSFEATAIAHIGGLDRYTAEDRLFALTALSLVSEEETERYRQHPLLADYAAEQLGDNTLPFVDLALFYQQFAEKNAHDYSALRPEWENLMVGIATAHRLQQWPLVIAYAESLTQAWFVRARYTQARQGYELAYSAAAEAKDEHAQAIYLLRWGQACVEQNDYDEARTLLIQSLEHFMRNEETEGIASVNYLLGRIAIEDGDYEKAAELLNTSQQLRADLGDAVGLAATLYQQALLAYRQNDYLQAQRLCENALATQTEANDLAGLLPTLRLLVDVAIEQKEYAAAEEYCERALALSEELQDRGELAATYYSLTVVHRLQKKAEDAKGFAEQALALCRWMGNKEFEALTLYELSRIHRQQKALPAALEAGRTSLAIFRELHAGFNLVYVLRHLAVLYEEVDELEQACTMVDEAMTLAETINHPRLPDLRQHHARLCNAS